MIMENFAHKCDTCAKHISICDAIKPLFAEDRINPMQSVPGDTVLWCGEYVPAALSAIDPEAIRREYEEKITAAMVDMKTVAKAEMPSAKDVLARLVADTMSMARYYELEAAILSAKPAQDDGKAETAIFEEIKDWLISKSGQYKSEYIQASIVMLRNMFEERAADVKRRIDEVEE